MLSILLIPAGNTPWEVLQVISKLPTSPFSPDKDRVKVTIRLFSSRVGLGASHERGWSGSVFGVMIACWIPTSANNSPANYHLPSRVFSSSKARQSKRVRKARYLDFWESFHLINQILEKPGEFKIPQESGSHDKGHSQDNHYISS